MRDPTELRRRAGVGGDPAADQHFLEDERVLDRIIEYAMDAAFDLTSVLEIGPGTGALTARLLPVAEAVHAIERDPDLVSFLRREFDAEIRAGALHLVEGDALEVDYPRITSCISNLPYGVSSQVIFRLLPLGVPILVMVQREFGERMAAGAGTSEYGRLSVTSQHYGDVEVVEIVPPSVFHPPPPVESALVRVLPRPPAYRVQDEDRFFHLVTGVFTQRRKTLRNGIRNTTHITGITDPAAVIDALDEDTVQARPGELEPAVFARMANIVTDLEGPSESHP